MPFQPVYDQSPQYILAGAQGLSRGMESLADKLAGVQEQRKRDARLSKSLRQVLDILDPENADVHAGMGLGDLIGKSEGIQLRSQQEKARWERNLERRKLDLLAADMERKRELFGVGGGEPSPGYVQTQETRMPGKPVSRTYKNVKTPEYAVPFFGKDAYATSPAGAKELRTMTGSVGPSIDGILELEAMINEPWKRLSLTQRGRAKAVQGILSGLLRLPLVGPGALSDAERAMIKDVVADPTKIFSLDVSNKAKLQELRAMLVSKMRYAADSEGIQWKPSDEWLNGIEERVGGSDTPARSGWAPPKLTPGKTYYDGSGRGFKYEPVNPDDWQDLKNWTEVK